MSENTTGKVLIHGEAAAAESTKPFNVKWIESNTKQTCSPLGADVAIILGMMAGGGIYNAPINPDKVDWGGDNFTGVHVSWRHSIASFDSDALSVLWVEATRRMIRVSISPCNPQYIRIGFHRRKGRPGELGTDGHPLGISYRLPDCEAMIAEIDRRAGKGAREDA